MRRGQLQEISERIDQLRREIDSLEGVLEGFPTPEQSAHAQQLVGHLRNAAVRNELATRQAALVDLNRQAAALADDVPLPTTVSPGSIAPRAQVEVPSPWEPAPAEMPGVEADATVVLESGSEGLLEAEDRGGRGADRLGEETLQLEPEPLPRPVSAPGEPPAPQAEAARESYVSADAAEETLEVASPSQSFLAADDTVTPQEMPVWSPDEQGQPAVEPGGGGQGSAADQPVAPQAQAVQEPPEILPTLPVPEAVPEPAAVSGPPEAEAATLEPSSQDRIGRFIQGVGPPPSEIEPPFVPDVTVAPEVTGVEDQPSRAELAAMVNIRALPDAVEPAEALETSDTPTLAAVSEIPVEVMPAEAPATPDLPVMAEEPAVAAGAQGSVEVWEMAEPPAPPDIPPVAALPPQPESAPIPEISVPAAVDAPTPAPAQAPAAAASSFPPVRLVEPPRERRKLALPIGLGAAALLVVGAGVFVLMGRGQPAAPPAATSVPAGGTGLNVTPVAAVATQPPTSAPTAAAPTARPTEVPTPTTDQISGAPEPAAEAEPEPEVAVEPEPALPTGTIQAPGFASVNLRRAPSSSAPSIRAVPVGTRVEMLPGRTTADGLTWQQIRTPQGEEGWVSAGTIAR